MRRSDRVPFLELVEPRLLLALFTVTSAADDGAGTLRQVIESLDRSTDLANTVSFDIGSGPQTISLQSSLPAITVPVFIDGESQPGYSDTPLIQIDGNGVLGSGLTLSPGSDGSTIRGLDIYGFSQQGAGLLIQSSDNFIESSYLGTDGTGTIEEPNNVGVLISGTNPFSVPKYNEFSGCRFTGNMGAGVYMSGADSNTFTGCTFTGNTSDGVYMNNVEFNSFISCTFTGNTSDGVYMSSASSNTFTGCTSTGNTDDGVEMSSADSNIFKSCNFSGNSYGNTDDGVEMSSADSNIFKSCNFTGNSNDGVYMSSASSNTFTGCTSTGNTSDGVEMSSADSNIFKSCNFSGNSYDGVFMSSAFYNTFTGCTSTGNSFDGVYMNDVGDNSFESCTFSGNSVYGVIMLSAGPNTFTGCTFSGNSVDGVYMSSDSSNTFTGCTFSGNSVDGVYVSSADSNTFTYCTFTGNSFDGLEISGSFFNIVTGCTIAGNKNSGIDINLMSDDNVIDENYIVGTPSNGSSTQQVGILINDSINNTIGGTTAGSTTPANVIGGNNVGIEITGFNSNLTGANVIEGNYIGVTEDGSAIGNLYGIWIDDVPSYTIGGTAKGAGNTISDNIWADVYIFGPDATGNLIEGNSILGSNNKGTRTSSPTNPLPIGVFIQNSSSNTIGGAGAGNTIYGNNVGVYIVGTGGASTNNQVLGNFIGLSANGASRPGNVLYGVILVNAPNNNVPQSGPSANTIVDSGIANYREYSGPIEPTTQSSSGSGSKAKKPANHSNHVAHQSPRRTALHAQVTVHGHSVPAGPLRKPLDRVRH